MVRLMDYEGVDILDVVIVEKLPGFLHLELSVPQRLVLYTQGFPRLRDLLLPQLFLNLVVYLHYLLVEVPSLRG